MLPSPAPASRVRGAVEDSSKTRVAFNAVLRRRRADDGRPVESRLARRTMTMSMMMTMAMTMAQVPRRPAARRGRAPLAAHVPGRLRVADHAALPAGPLRHPLPQRVTVPTRPLDEQPLRLDPPTSNHFDSTPTSHSASFWSRPCRRLRHARVRPFVAPPSRPTSPVGAASRACRAFRGGVPGRWSAGGVGGAGGGYEPLLARSSEAGGRLARRCARRGAPGAGPAHGQAQRLSQLWACLVD